MGRFRTFERGKKERIREREEGGRLGRMEGGRKGKESEGGGGRGGQETRVRER